jgi:uncharacterized membrane protein
MSEVEKQIEVDVPVATAYNQWTQFETFPRFMEGVEEVRQLDDRTVHWRARIGGKEEEWDAVITVQEPDRRIAWRSISGAANAGDVRFEAADGGGKAKVTLHLVYQPEGAVEKAGTAVGALDRQVEGDLERFKRFVEAGGETGAWRGEIHQSAPSGTDNPERGPESSPRG